MKLASLKEGRDGRLVVVSEDLAYCADAGHIVPRGGLAGWRYRSGRRGDMKLVECRGHSDQINRG